MLPRRIVEMTKDRRSGRVSMILSIVLGLLMGPVLNWLADRLPLNQPLLARPTCPSCGEEIAPLAYVAWLRLLPTARRFHGCAPPGSARRLLVELATVALFLLSWIEVGLSWSFVPASFVL